MQGLKMPDGLNIRPANHADNPFLEKLHHSTRQDLQLIDADKEVVESIMELQLKAQTQGYGSQFPNAMYFVVERHCEPIGKVTVDFGHNEVRLVDLALIPAARGKGLGAEIIRAFQQAATMVAVPMTLSVMQSNFPAKALYQKLGFVTASVEIPYELMVWSPPAMKLIQI